jgi:hypothetical protein
MFPHDAAQRINRGMPWPDDVATLRAACVEGMLKGLHGAFAWHQYLDDLYPLQSPAVTASP